MKYSRLHPWEVTTAEAREIQIDLGRRLLAEWDGRDVNTIAAADVGFPDKSTVLAAVVVLTFPGLEVVETQVERAECRFPYVPGYLSFREVPALLACLEKVRAAPDVLLCDAQGLARPAQHCSGGNSVDADDQQQQNAGSYSVLFQEHDRCIHAR